VISFNKLFYVVTCFLALYAISSCTPPAPSLGVSPGSAVLTPNESVTLTAALLNTSLVSDIAWTSTGGILSGATGTSVTFRAEQEGFYKITATAIADPALTRTVNITVAQATTVGSAETPSVNDGTLAGASSKTYIIRPSRSLTKDALYFELVSDASVKITLYGQNGRAIATSDNPNYFSESDSSLALSSQAITTSSICRGPCIIVPGRSEGFVLTIENQTPISATYDLYIYNENFTDTLEDSENCNPSFSSNLLAPSIEITPPEPIVRAIETLGDEDCFYSQEFNVKEVTLATFDSTALRIEVDVYQVRSSVDTRFVGSLSAGSGQDNDILTFDPSYPVLIVAKSGNGRAGPSGSSRYEVNYY
jgi:hypothetical protein